MRRTRTLLLWSLLTMTISQYAFGGDLAFGDPARQPPPPAGAVGYPSREANLDALPGFVKPPPGYGEVPFYWWLGDPLSKERLTWQLDQLAGKGIEGLQINYAHSDQGGQCWGLTYPSDPPLFSAAWWKLVDWFAAEAKKRGMAVSLSDYTLGIVGQGYWTDEILKEQPDLRGSVLEVALHNVEGGKECSWEVPEKTVGDWSTMGVLANHYGTIPTRYRGSPLSGLLGPVRVESLPPASATGTR